MKVKYVFVFLLVVGVIFVWSTTATATTYQNQTQQTIVAPVTPQPIVPTPIPPDCELEMGIEGNRSLDCLPNKTNLLQNPPVDMFPAMHTQIDTMVWQPVDSPTSNFLEDISMLSATDGWAVGNNGTTLHWNGSSWQNIASPTQYNLSGVFMLAPNDVWAVGGWDPVSQSEVSIILHWDGNTWQIVPTPTTLPLSSIYMISSTDGWAVGGKWGESVIIHWDGTVWTTMPSPVPSPALLIDVDMLSSTNGWAVGNFGTILHWDGSTWQLVPSPTALYIISIDMISETDGWAVGGINTTGEILHWDGNSWQLVPATINRELASVSMASATDGWAVGRFGAELLYWDGVSWTNFSSPVIAAGIDMISSSDGWAVGYGIMHYTPFNALTVHVENSSGQPASDAYVRVYAPDGSYISNGYGWTDTNGDAFLNIQPGTYNIAVYSESEHFGLYQLNITSPSTVNLTAEGTPAIALTAKKRDNTPLDQASVRVALSSGPLYINMSLGQVDTNGQMIFNITPGVYDVSVFDTDNYYDLLKRQQTFSGAGGTLDFDMSTNPTAEIVVSHPGESIEGMYLSHPWARVYGTWFSEVAEGTHVVLSANEDYSAYQEIVKDAINGDHWYYDLDENRPDSTFQPGEVFTFTVGGALTVTGRTESAYVGDYINLAAPRDSHDNTLTRIITQTADYNWGGYMDPYIYLTDPNGVGTQLSRAWYYIPYTAPTGWYQVHYEWETGPYQGLLVADSAFEVRPIATSAIIQMGGGALNSTFDSTSYAFANGTFTDTVIITHTACFADIPSFGTLVGIGHTFDITAVYSSTRQPAQPTQPYTITIYYTDDERGSAIEDTVALYYWDGSQWVKDTSSVVDAQNNVLTATPSHFSLWAAMGETRRVYLPLVGR